MTEHEEPQGEPEVTSDDRLQKIGEVRAVVKVKGDELEKAQAKLEGAKSLVKLKQQAYDEAVGDLLDVIDNKQHEFAFGDTEPQAERGAWRAVPLDIEIIPHAHIVRKLADVDVTTLGELSDAIAADPQNGAQSIKGIGEVAAEKIENALETYWHLHPEHAVGAATDESAEAEGEAAEQ